MAAGTDSWDGLAVPLFGDSEIRQRTAATDILTIRGAASQTGDFLVLRDSDLTEKFVIKAGGYLSHGSITTPPTTGLSEGDMFIGMGSSTPQIGICYSTAANSLRYITADTKTWGRTTA